jgi:hypothetical protein
MRMKRTEDQDSLNASPDMSGLLGAFKAAEHPALERHYSIDEKPPYGDSADAPCVVYSIVKLACCAMGVPIPRGAAAIKPCASLKAS